MQFGIHLRELWRLRLGVVVVLTLSTLAALWVSYDVDLSPPGLHARSLEMGTASTRVLVDTPKSIVLDVRQGTYDFQSLDNRALLLGNVMAGLPVREYIARRVGIAADALQVTAPLTPELPRAIADPANDAHTSDILRSTDQYRLSIKLNPTVPVLDVYAQAPTAEGAASLANGAVDGLQSYLDTVAGSQGIRAGNRVQLKQLGRARGSVINRGIRLEVALLSFFVVLGASAAAVLFISRVQRGWRLGAEKEAAAPSTGTPV